MNTHFDDADQMKKLAALYPAESKTFTRRMTIFAIVLIIIGAVLFGDCPEKGNRPYRGLEGKVR